MKNFQEFEKFYKKMLYGFCSEKQISPYKKSYEKHYTLSYGSNKDEEIIKDINAINIKELYLSDYAPQFIAYLLKNANEIERQQIVNNNFSLFDYDDLAQSSYHNAQDMKDIFKYLSKEKVFKSYGWERTIKDMQEKCDSKLYDQVIDIFLSGKIKEVQNKNNKIIINLMLNTVKDDKIYEKYNNLIPNNEIEDNFFDSLAIDCFDLNVSKDKLYSSIPLSNKDQYNDMHTTFLDKVNNDKLKEIMGIICIDGEVKFKSSKYYRYVCRLKEGGLLNKENTQMLIISFYKLYAQTINNRQEGEYEYKLIQEISPEMIHNNYLSYKLSKNKPESNKEKKVKI